MQTPEQNAAYSYASYLAHKRGVDPDLIDPRSLEMWLSRGDTIEKAAQRVVRVLELGARFTKVTEQATRKIPHEW